MLFPSFPELPQEALEAYGVACRELGQSLAGVYLFGSGATDGLRPGSDVDLLVLVDEPLSDAVREGLVSRLMAASGRPDGDGPARPLEVTVLCRSDVVPWRYPPRCELLYGEWLRREFEQGRIPQAGPNPDLAIVLTQVRTHGAPLLGPEATEVLEPVPVEDVRRAIADTLPQLLEGRVGDERNVLLTLARMWMTVETGEIASKEVAAAWALSRLSEEHQPLLELAQGAYLGHYRDAWTGKESELDRLVHDMRSAIEQGLERSRG